MLDRELEEDSRGKDGLKIRLWVHAVELEALRTRGSTTAQLRRAVSQALHHPNLAAALNERLATLTGWDTRGTSPASLTAGGDDMPSDHEPHTEHADVAP